METLITIACIVGGLFLAASGVVFVWTAYTIRKWAKKLK